MSPRDIFGPTADPGLDALPSDLSVLQFPSVKAGQMLQILSGQPLQYEVARQRGSHRIMVSATGYPRLVFSFHDGETIPPGVVRKILTKDVGLSEDEARGLL